MKNLEKIFSLKKELESDLISLFYAGIFNDSFTDLLTQLTQHEDHKSIKNNLSYLMVEVFQNIIRYKNEEESKYEIFGLRSIEENLHLFSSNLINQEKEVFIKDKLNEINKKDKKELKKIYFDSLKSGVYGEKGGAGLGLLQMARKSANPIQFKFSEANDKSKLFQYQLDFSVNRGEKISDTQIVNIKNNISLYKNIYDDGVIFLFKGDFNKENANAILNIIQANTKSNSKEKKNNNYRIFHTSVELIQNISRHGRIVNNITEGIFCLIKDKNGFYLSSGNYIKEDQLSSVKDNFNFINKIDNSDLNNIYLKKLKENSRSESNQAGIGLIDVRRYNQSKFDYDIINDNIGYYLCTGILIPFNI